MASVPGSQRTGSAQGLLDPAWHMRWRVPELALVLSDRAAALARRAGDQAVRLRAEALALFASNRLGRGVPVTGRALAALRDAEAAGNAEVTAQVRVEVAWCARSAGSLETAVRVLEPVLALEQIDPEVRAHALLALAASLPAHRMDGERADALDEAERLYEGCEPHQDTIRLLKARVQAARAGHHRRLGEFDEAVAAANAGLALLDQLGDPATDSGEIHARLVLERVQSLLETGRRDEAARASEPVLAMPVRAAAAGPVGWLGLALAARVHLPDGNHGSAIRVLNDSAAVAERHKLDGLLAESLNTLSHVHETGEDFGEALRTLRGAYAADRRWRAAVHAARIRLLAEFPVRAAEVPSDLAASRQPGPSPSSEHPPLLSVVAEPLSEPHTAEPHSSVPQSMPSVEPRLPRHSDPEATEQEQTEPDPRQETARDAVRRLMETLTNRAAELREESQSQEAMSEPAESTFPAYEPPVWRMGAETAEVPAEQVALAGPTEESVEPHFPAAEPVTEPATAKDTAQEDSWWPPALWEQSTGANTAIPEAPTVSGRDSGNGASTAESGHPSTVVAMSGATDVTAIMPAIWAPSEPEPQDWPTHSTVEKSGASHEQPNEPASSPREEPPNRDGKTPPAGEPATSEQQEGGRRSRGKSLAEIRASLHLSDQPRAGRRRARHAEPDESATLAPEVHGRHRQGWPTEPEPPAATALEPATPATDDEPEPAGNSEPPASDVGSGKKIGLAELLTEALMAYEDARRSQEAAAERARSGRHTGENVSGITQHSHAFPTLGSSTSDDRGSGAVARHRRGGMDSAAADPLL